MNRTEQPALLKQIEAVLIVSSDPLTHRRATELFGLTASEFDEALTCLSDHYDSTDRAFFIQKVAGGVRLAARPEMAETLELFALTQTPPRLSGAVMETLALIAYRQPISRAQISAIRGVNSDHAVKMLMIRGYVEVSSREIGPSGARPLRTTSFFLEKLGIFSISDLPRIDGFLPSIDEAEQLEASLFDDAL